MTVYHLHHIIPKHMGGSDDPSNLIKLTIEEHAEAHKTLWEEHGNEYDLIAWKSLSGLIDCEIARREAASIAQKERWQKTGEKERQSQKMKGNDYGKAKKGWNPGRDTRDRMSVAKVGRKQRRCSCVICQKEISVSNVTSHYRWNHVAEEEQKTFRKVFVDRFEQESFEERQNRIRKASENNKGKKRSDETRKKMSKSAKNYDYSKRYIMEITSTNTSGHRGVSYNKATKKWVSYICKNKKHLHLGSYDNKEDAISVRKRAEEDIKKGVSKTP